MCFSKEDVQLFNNLMQRTEKDNKQLDLLKSSTHKPTQKFLDIILDNGLLPSITRLTRITQQSATLIDNIFISGILQQNVDSTILVHNISDHLPIITLMKQTNMVDKNSIEFQSRKLTNRKIETIKQNLQNIDWDGHLNSNDCKIDHEDLISQ